MLRARLARLWINFCDGDVFFDPLGGAYCLSTLRGPDPDEPWPATRVDDQGALRTSDAGLYEPYEAD